MSNTLPPQSDVAAVVAWIGEHGQDAYLAARDAERATWAQGVTLEQFHGMSYAERSTLQAQNPSRYSALLSEAREERSRAQAVLSRRRAF